MTIRSLLLLLLSIYSQTSWAQELSTSAFPRLYAGLQYGRHDYQLAFSANPGSLNIGPGRTNARRAQLTLGYQFKYNLAVQVGISPNKESFSYGGIGTNNAGQPLTELGLSTGSSMALPVLLRYTSPLKPWKNLHLDALAGAVFFWSRSKSEFTRTENGVITAQSQSNDKINNTLVALGPSVRYEFGRHIAGFADWMFYKNLRSSKFTYPGSNADNKTGITNSINIGIRYRFWYK